MKMMNATLRKSSTGETVTDRWVEYAVCLTGCWVTVIFIISLFNVRWFVPGDFSYQETMIYHGIMIPLLLLFYFTVIQYFSLKLFYKRFWIIVFVIAVFFAGIGSVFHVEESFSFAAALQVTGMVLIDILGFVLFFGIIFKVWGKDRENGPAYLLLLFSILAVLIAAPLGHLAGFNIDLGAEFFPVINRWIHNLGITADTFQEGVVTSHSHLIVAAFLFALASMFVLFFHIQGQIQRKIINAGLWIILLSLVCVTAVYIFSALFGWEPPDIFMSGPGGIPLDDLFLASGLTGLLVLIAGLWEMPKNLSGHSQDGVRMVVFLCWLFLFIGTVIPGIYIELHEQFYGGGATPAPGAQYDQVFIRVHMLFSFLFLPIVLTFLLAIGYRYDKTGKSSFLPVVFIWSSVVAIVILLIGEFLWFITLNKIVFFVGFIIGGAALLSGTFSFLPTKLHDNKEIVSNSDNST